MTRKNLLQTPQSIHTLHSILILIPIDPKSNAIFVMKMFKRIKIAIAQGQGFLCTAVAFSRLHCKLADRRIEGAGPVRDGPVLSHAWPHGLVQEGVLKRPSTAEKRRLWFQGPGSRTCTRTCTWPLGKNANILLRFRPE